jgi:hypothetical protein
MMPGFSIDWARIIDGGIDQMKRCHIAALAVAVLSITGCESNLLGQLTGANSLVGSPQASGSLNPEVPVVTTVRTYEKSAVLLRDNSFTFFDVWRSANLDIRTGEEGSSNDFGQLVFQAHARLGSGTSLKDGFFVVPRQYSNADMQVSLGAIDKGAVELASVTEAPEFGYSASTEGTRNFVELKAGNLYILRVKADAGANTYYAKLFVKDLESTKITYTLVTQTMAGDRKF